MTNRKNKHVENTLDQIQNTLQLLSALGMTRITKEIVCISPEKGYEILTWNNHIPGRHNAGKAFTTLEQYLTIYESGAYHCILFDGSIIRVYFKFNKNILLQQSLLYWPAPVVIPEDEVDELGIREALYMYLSDEKTINKKILMRSPFRYDFDSSKSNESHPMTHVHFQHPECRISAKKPICFNTFIVFIFKYFYPDFYPRIMEKLEQLNYSGYQEFDNAVICL